MFLYFVGVLLSGHEVLSLDFNSLFPFQDIEQYDRKSKLRNDSKLRLYWFKVSNCKIYFNFCNWEQLNFNLSLFIGEKEDEKYMVM